MRDNVGGGLLLLLIGSSLFSVAVVLLAEGLRWASGRVRVVEIIREVTRDVPGETQIVYRALPEDTSQYVTVVETLTRLGITPHKELTWSLGRLARDRHIEVYGVPPRKVGRTKTNGTGSHDFAGYPPEFVPELEALIKGVQSA